MDDESKYIHDHWYDNGLDNCPCADCVAKRRKKYKAAGHKHLTNGNCAICYNAEYEGIYGEEH